jgi:hypothetical protein
MHGHRRLLTQKRIFSLTYYEVGTSGNALKCILFQLVYGSTITDQSVYFYISNSVGITSPVEFASEASHSGVWENHDLTLQPVITYTANPRITRLIRSEKSSRNTKTHKVN